MASIIITQLRPSRRILWRLANTATWQRASQHLALDAFACSMPAISSASTSVAQPAWSHSCSYTTGHTTEAADANRKTRLSRLLYRSKQRGFLELDLLVGLWAQENLPRMDDQHVAAFEQVLDEENPDLYKWLTGQADAPEYMVANPTFCMLRGAVSAQLAQHHTVSSQEGKAWIRGYDDGRKST